MLQKCIYTRSIIPQYYCDLHTTNIIIVLSTNSIALFHVVPEMLTSP